jgi:sulfotransferase
MRRSISDDPFMLSQLDTSFKSSYGHLTTAMRGFLRGWYQDCTKRAVVD